MCLSVDRVCVENRWDGWGVAYQRVTAGGTTGIWGYGDSPERKRYWRGRWGR